jgi:leader peptidase (prepilin peptidase)/N-methyltransferase
MPILHYLQAHPAAFLIFTGILGLMVGSFLNVVIYRLPVVLERDWSMQCAEVCGEEGQTATKPERFNLVVPRSRCPQCGHPIAAWENIPVLSYLLLRGRCSACGASISLRYPLVEVLTAVLSFAVAWRFGLTWQAGGGLLLTWALIALSFIDFDRQLLPDVITLPWLWLGLGISLLAVYTHVADSVLGAMLGYLLLWSVYHVFRLLTGKEGMGYGDFKLLAMLGAWTGWQMVPLIVLLSSFVGAVVGVVLIVARGHDRNIPIPFGPYLAIAGWIALLWGQDLVQAYLRWSAWA